MRRAGVSVAVWLFLAAFVTLGQTPSSGQKSSIGGIVRDAKSGKPLSHATVGARGLSYSAKTGFAAL
jgi:hypothetical protein